MRSYYRWCRNSALFVLSQTRSLVYFGGHTVLGSWALKADLALSAGQLWHNSKERKIFFRDHGLFNMKNSSLMTPPSTRTDSNSKNTTSARNRRKQNIVRDSGISAESGHSSQSETVKNFCSEDDDEEAEEKTGSIHQPNSK